jgi:hypothetical protein
VTAEDVLAAGPRRPPARPRRTGPPGRGSGGRWLRWGALGAAAVVTMLLAGPPVPISAVRGTATPPPGPKLPCRPAPVADLTAPRLADPVGLRADGRVTACAGRHMLLYAGARAGAVASLLLYAPGMLDPAPLLGDRQVRVGGHTGYLGTHPEGLSPDPDVSGFQVATLAWEYAPGAWAVAQQVPDPPADPTGPLPEPVPPRFLPTGLAIAATVRPDLPRVPLRVPVRLGYLPDGLALTTVEGITDGTRRADGSGWLEFGSADAAAAGCAEQTCLSRLDVRVFRQRHKFPIESYVGRVVKVGDTRGLVTTQQDGDGRRQPSLTVFRGDWEITVSSDSHGRPVPVPELVRIAAEARLAPAVDPAGYFPLTAAIPD